MKLENLEVLEAATTEDAFVELSDLQLALIGGGIGETTLGTTK